MLHAKLSTSWWCLLLAKLPPQTQISCEPCDKILNSSQTLFRSPFFFLAPYSFTLSGLLSQMWKYTACQMNTHTHAQTNKQTDSHYHIIPESSRSMESSWNVGEHSGRKAMLSRLGGAAMTSSGPPFSLDSRSGNSRQDETHPDTMTAPALSARCDSRGWGFAQNILFSSEFLFFWPWLFTLLLLCPHSDVLSVWEIPKQLFLVLFSALLRNDFPSTETKQKEFTSLASSYWLFNLFWSCCVT